MSRASARDAGPLLQVRIGRLVVDHAVDSAGSLPLALHAALVQRFAAEPALLRFARPLADAITPQVAASAGSAKR